MRALVYERYATDDDFARILRIRDDMPIPVPGSGEVVFKVKAAALNYDDIWGMRGKPLAVPLPHVSGTDAAGEVTAVGSDVRHVRVGDRVVSHGNMSCRICRACTSGREYDCKRRSIWGFQTGPLWGGYCEFAHLPEVNVVRIPDAVSYDEAAAASMTMLTSWHMLVGRAGIRPGQVVLIMGGSSGVGSYAIQIAKLFGCTVIATASPGKLQGLLDLGADHAVDHRDGGWHRKVRLIAGGIPKPFGEARGVDVIFEHLGGSHWGRELALLNYGGTIVTTGATTGYDVRTDLRHVFFKGINVLGSTQGTRAELEQGLYWMSQGRIRSVIDSAYPLERAAEAHARMLAGRGLFGKILIKPEMVDGGGGGGDDDDNNGPADPGTDRILDEANGLFLHGRTEEAVLRYDEILRGNPAHPASLNNKGYALSKQKDYDGAIACYDAALRISPDDAPATINKISSLRKQGEFSLALRLCDRLLRRGGGIPRDNTVLYHKERILLSMGRFAESVSCCDRILEDYPDNADVLFDKSCGLAMLSRGGEALDLLERAVSSEGGRGAPFRAKAKRSGFFKGLHGDARFQGLVS